MSRSPIASGNDGWRGFRLDGLPGRRAGGRGARLDCWRRMGVNKNRPTLVTDVVLRKAISIARRVTGAEWQKSRIGLFPSAAPTSVAGSAPGTRCVLGRSASSNFSRSRRRARNNRNRTATTEIPRRSATSCDEKCITSRSKHACRKSAGNCRMASASMRPISRRAQRSSGLSSRAAIPLPRVSSADPRGSSRTTSCRRGAGATRRSTCSLRCEPAKRENHPRSRPDCQRIARGATMPSATLPGSHLRRLRHCRSGVGPAGSWLARRATPSPRRLRGRPPRARNSRPRRDSRQAHRIRNKT